MKSAKNKAIFSCVVWHILGMLLTAVLCSEIIPSYPLCIVGSAIGGGIIGLRMNLCIFDILDEE